MNIHNTPQPIIDRLMRHYRVSEETGCWEWTAAKNDKGYGTLRVGTKKRGKKLMAHRAMWAEKNGPIPPGLCICHSCDNPGCINPQHLWLGTNIENHRDKARKGRAPSGESHWKAKLRREAAADIRARFSALREELAAKYGVSLGTIAYVASGKGWRGDETPRDMSPAPYANRGSLGAGL